jgi:hypothetical protein
MLDMELLRLPLELDEQAARVHKRISARRITTLYFVSSCMPDFARYIILPIF